MLLLPNALGPCSDFPLATPIILPDAKSLATCFLFLNQYYLGNFEYNFLNY